jgi:hypothetical protein
MGKLKQTLESILKRYTAPVGIASLQTPLHEGLHAILAKVLPHSTCDGIILNNSNFWYTKPLKYLTFGFYDTADLGNLGGITKISYMPDFLGNMSQTIASVVPEVATMTLGFYWIKNSINNISTKGRRMYSLVTAYCGTSLVSLSFSYLKNSSISPDAASDHLNFTRGILQMAHMPQAIAPYVTFIGAAGMMAGSLYLAKVFSELNNKENAEISQPPK